MRPFRKHQYAAFRYCLKTRHPALFMEMRLGKCMVTIRRIKLYTPLDNEPCGFGLKVLVVAPSSALGTWESELSLEGESFKTVEGTRQHRLDVLQYGGGTTWFLINKEGFLSTPEIRNAYNWDAVVLDEATFVKNPKAQVTKFFLKNFRDCPHRWILTGTPNPENDLELWPQLAFLDGGAFGYRNFWDFRAQKFSPDSMGYAWVPNPGTSTLIRQTLSKRCFIQRRKDVGVEATKEYVVRTLEFPQELRKQYDKAETDFELPSGEQTIWATNKYNWLRQMCGGFVDKKPVWDGKLLELRSLLEGELRNEKVVVWFHFNHELYHVLNNLNAANLHAVSMTGDDTRGVRESKRKAWCGSKYRILLVQQAIAQMGMDLSAADTAIYYSQTPSALASIQVEDRILSLAKKSTLLYVYLNVKNSVDQDLHSALKAKKFSSSLTLSRALAIAVQERTNAICKSAV